MMTLLHNIMMVVMLYTGPCPMARLSDNMLQCDEFGNYKPLQCREIADSRTYRCECVEPSSGRSVPNTLVQEVSNRDELPDCGKKRVI
jgi:hypothetical protein